MRGTDRLARLRDTGQALLHQGELKVRRLHAADQVFRGFGPIGKSEVETRAQ
jgi:hypothetical protein